MSAPLTLTKWAEVDTGALRANTAALRRFCGVGCRLMAMVKANGYGHGSVLAAHAALAGGADWLGVSSIAEGMELREAGLSAPILNVGWTPSDDIVLAARNDIDVTVFTTDAVEAARQASRVLGRPARVQWKIDSGMRRLGTPPAQVADMRDRLRADRLLVVSGLFTHFAAADAPSLEATQRQHQQFTDLIADVRGDFPDALVHSANSAALLRFRASHHDMTRPGIALYGYPPPHCEGIVELLPAMTVRALVTQVRRVAAGESIGYGHAWTAPTDSLVAMLAAGYADGLDRRNGGNGQVLLEGVLCPLVGMVSMDQCAVDVSAVDGVVAGTVATILGPAVTPAVDAAAVASRIGTIPYEVLCAVSARVPRIPVDAQGGSA